MRLRGSSRCDSDSLQLPATPHLGVAAHGRSWPPGDRAGVRDYEIHDRGMAVHVLAPGCHEAHTTEIAVATGPTPALAERWPQSGGRTVRGLAWLSNEAVVVRGFSMPLVNARDVHEAVGASQYGWNGSALIGGPLVESGAIEDGCDGG